MDVPDELRFLGQWMLWRRENGTKVPYMTNGHRGKSNDASCWSTYMDCIESPVQRDGIAFVFSNDDPYCGIDLDDCIVDGVYEPWAQEILAKFEGVAYCEISPSGAGVKLTTRARKPTRSRCTNGMGVECYDNKRFWTVTGNCIGPGFESIGNGQIALDWLIETHLHGVERKIGTKRLNGSAQVVSQTLISRAQAYVDSVPSASKGNLRNAAFKLSGHLHSMIGDSGERLGDSDVYALLVVWNGRNTDQLRDDELHEATINGRKNGTPPADKLPSMQKNITYDVDLSEFEIPNPINGNPDENAFPGECLAIPGIIQDVMEYTYTRSMYPQPILALAGALALMSTITGRKVQSDYGTRTNLYVLGLAPSGAGKEQSRKTNKELLDLAGAAHLVGPERIGSSAGLTSFVQAHLSPLFQVDEIGRLLQTMKNPGKNPHLYNVGTVLMQLYSSSDQRWVGDAYADARRIPMIDQPHCVVYGTAVPDGFWDGLTKESLCDGLLGRMMIFEAPGYVPKKRPTIVEPSEPLVASVRWWIDFRPGGNLAKLSPVPVMAYHTQDARDRFESHLDNIDDRKKHDAPEPAALWSRSGEKVAKLALIFACSRQRETDQISINIDDVNHAIRLGNWLTRQMIIEAERHISSNEVEASRKRVMRIVNKHGGRMTLSELTRKTQWLRRKERAEFLDELRDTGQIVIQSEETGGRPAMWVVAQ